MPVFNRTQAMGSSDEEFSIWEKLRTVEGHSSVAEAAETLAPASVLLWQCSATSTSTTCAVASLMKKTGAP